MNPVLLNLGFLEIRWYSILVLSGFIIGYFLVLNKLTKKGLNPNIISDMCFYLIIFCILGARLHYCLFYIDELGNNPYFSNPLDIIKIWEGGLGIHGGIIGGFIFLYFYTKKKKLNLLEIMDAFAPALVLGQCIGRWGNFFNSEAFGKVVSLEHLKNLHIPNFIIDGMFIKDRMYPMGAYRQPTFLYESLACLIIFIILLIIRNKKSIKDGQVVGTYFIFYGIVRFFIESLRTDSLMIFNFKTAQIISIIMIIIGIYLIIRPYIRRSYDKQKMGHSTKR